MRVCYIVSEIFGRGQIGGFGKLVRLIGKALAEKGIEVKVITWRRCKEQPKTEIIDGMTVLSFPYIVSFSISSKLTHVFDYASSLSTYKRANADIYVSIDPQLTTYMAQKVMPDKKHVVYFQDPYDEKAYKDLSLVDSNYEWNRRKQLEFYSVLAVLRHACRNSDLLLTQARFFMPSIKRLFKPKADPIFLPNPVSIPTRIMRKSSEPTVCFVGRWDPQKRVKKFFDLATYFPKVKFIAIGKSNDPRTDQFLRSEYRQVKNLSMLGFISDEEKSRILEESWVMINTSIREGLPISFLEASAHKTAILSYVNPDNFASNFGYHVPDEDFAGGLKALLQDNLWQEKGEKGYDYVKSTHEIGKVINDHVRLYEKICG
jgi:glycosyltransferase involved in cell wall biosynthesis